MYIYKKTLQDVCRNLLPQHIGDNNVINHLILSAINIFFS